MIEIIDRGAKEQDLVLFKFNKEDFNNGLVQLEWKEKNEFRKDGQMYDIVKKEIKGDSVYLYCVHDTKESFLYSSLDQLSKQGNNEKAKSLDRFRSLLSQFYFRPFEIQNNSSPYKKGNYCINISLNLLEGEYPLSTPPPRS